MDPTKSIFRELGDFFVFIIFHGCWCFSMRLTMVHFHFAFYALLVANVEMPLNIMMKFAGNFFSPYSIAFNISGNT